MTEILMPALSNSMEQGLIVQWLAAEGSEIAVGDELCEIETDKATMAYEAEIAGALHIVAPEGTTVAVGQAIATVGEAMEAEHRPTTAPAAPAADHAAVATNGTAATPLARRLAAEHDVALVTLTGTGPRGRITKADVMAAAGIAPPPARELPARAPAAAPTAAASNGSGGRQELTRTQQLIARRMAEASATIPHFQVETEVAFDAAIELRAGLQAAAAHRAGVTVPSLNDLIVKASALALRAHPRANGSYRDGGYELHDHVNVGIAVATDGALVVPTVFDADTRSLGEIAATTRALAEKVRAGTVTPPELSGATFTVSNLGMFGMTAITSVINPPQAAILGVGAARATLARDPETGEILDRKLLTLRLSCDHRILYGADAARFLAEIRELLEAPLLLAV